MLTKKQLSYLKTEYRSSKSRLKDLLKRRKKALKEAQQADGRVTDIFKESWIGSDFYFAINKIGGNQ